MERPERFDRLLASLGCPRTGGTRRLPTRSRDELPVVPDHELIRCIGQGAYGEVWLARNVLGTYRAVKIVFRDSFNSDQPYEREFRGIQRFEPISRANEGLMDILQVGRNDAQGCFYYVIELADDVSEIQNSKGQIQRCESYVPSTLARLLHQRGRLPAAECVPLGLALTSALGHLHRQGLIHRDIKPSNIIFVQGVPKLADIGLVVEVEEAFSFVGTEGYIPPEGPTSPQADLYSLGKVLYEASNGKDRKEYPEPMSGLRDLPDRAEQDLVLELNSIILKACAEDVRERYQSAEECHADLALIQSGKSVRRRRQLEMRVAVLTRVALGIGIAALVGFAGYAFQKGQTAVAKRLSEENRQLAEAETRQRERAESALLDVRLQRARELLSQQKNTAALTQLGQLLRQHPSNRFIAEQILWTLRYRNFALPIASLSDSNELTHVRFNSDGSRIVTASTNGSVRIWDARTGNPISTISLQEAGLRTVQISADGESIAMTGPGQVRVASLQTGLVKAMFADEGNIDQVAFNPDGSKLLIVTDGEVSVRESRTGELRVGPLKHKGKISSANFSAGGNCIITSLEEDSSVYLWDAQTGRLIGTFEHEPFQNFRTNPALSSDGTRIITLLTMSDMPGSAVRIWNTTTGEALSDLIDFTFPVCLIQFSPDGTKVIIGGNDRAAWICDGHTGRRLIGPLEYEDPISAASFSSDSIKIAVSDTTGLVRVWDSTNGAMIVDSFSRSGWIDSLAFSPNGEQLLVFGGGTAGLWDVGKGDARSITLQHDQSVTFAQFSRDGRRIVTAMDERVFSGQWSRPSQGRSARVWDAQSLQPLTPPLLHERGVITAAFSPNGDRVVTTSWDRTAKLWNAQTGDALCEPLRHEGAIRSVTFSEDGKRLWTGSWRHSAWLWDVEGVLIQDLLGNKGEISEFPFFPIRTDDLSADQKWLVTCSPESDMAKGQPGVQVWNAQTGERRYIRSPFGYTIRTARFSPDSERIVTSSAQARAAHIWSARTGELLVGPLEHKGQVLHYAEFSPDGSKVITAGHDGTARLWNSRTGQLIGRPMTHKGEVVHAAFSPDSKRVVTASWWDHAAFIWDAETGLQIGEALQHDDWVTFAAFSPDGKWVITTSADKTARIWEVPIATLPIPAWLPELAEAVAGQRIDNAENVEVVTPGKLIELKIRLTASAETDYYTRFAKWFFAERSTRLRSSQRFKSK